MKKYIWLAVGTVAALTVVLLLRGRIQGESVQVDLVTINRSSVRQTVECTGKVELAENQEVYVETPCIADEIYVREGQRVTAGEVLFSVDVAATQQVMAQLGEQILGINTPSAVVAPTDGVVTSLNVQSGKVMSNTEPCLVINAGDAVHIAVMIREKHISRIAVGQEVEITGVAFSKQLYHGTVAYIADTAHQEYIGTTSETVVDAIVTLREDEIDDSLRAGLNARASVVVNVIPEALLVPYTCIAQDDEGNEYIYVYNGDGTAVRKIPQFGEECGDGVLVLSGLEAGAQIVQDPETLSGSTVSVRVE